jgi:hypothetical protein
MTPLLILRIALAVASLIFGAWGSGNAYQLANLPDGVCASPGDTLLAAGPLAGAGLSAVGFLLTFIERFLGGLGKESSQALRAFIEWKREPNDKAKQRALVTEVGDVLIEIVRGKSKPIADKLAALLNEIYAEFLKDDSAPIVPAVESKRGAK